LIYLTQAAPYDDAKTVAAIAVQSFGDVLILIHIYPNVAKVGGLQRQGV